MTSLIIFITSIFSILAFGREQIMRKYEFNPYLIRHHKAWYRFLTHAFLHTDYTHLLINMLVLYMLGRAVEHIFVVHFGLTGYTYFMLLYFGGIIFSVVTTFRKYRNNHYYSSVGASGAVSAVVFAYITLDPLKKLSIYFIPEYYFPSILLGVIYLIYSYYKSIYSKDNINYTAHFWGAVFGILYTLVIVPEIIKEICERIFY